MQAGNESGLELLVGDAVAPSLLWVLSMPCRSRGQNTCCLRHVSGAPCSGSPVCGRRDRYKEFSDLPKVTASK